MPPATPPRTSEPALERILADYGAEVLSSGSLRLEADVGGTNCPEVTYVVERLPPGPGDRPEGWCVLRRVEGQPWGLLTSSEARELFRFPNTPVRRWLEMLHGLHVEDLDSYRMR